MEDGQRFWEIASEHTENTVTLGRNDPWGDPHVDGMVATLKSPAFTVKVGVPTSFGDGLDTFFRGLSEHWRGWEGSLRWESLGGDLSIAATHDGRGHVTLDVRGRDLHYSGPVAPYSTWEVGVALVIDVGSFDRLADSIRDWAHDSL